MKKSILGMTLAVAALAAALCAGAVSDAARPGAPALSTTHLLAAGIDPSGLATGEIRTTGDHHITTGHEADPVLDAGRGVLGR